jgi:hypothetical protein
LTSTDNEQDNTIQRFQNFFWSGIEGVEPPVPQPIAVVGQMVKAIPKKLQGSDRPCVGMRKLLKPGMALCPALDSSKNKVGALMASNSVFHKAGLDFQIAREFLPSWCFGVPLDTKCETGTKVLSIYEGTRNIPIVPFFNSVSKLSEENRLFAHWRSKIVAILCDISLYGSTARSIIVSAAGDVIAIVHTEKELDSREEPLTVPSVVSIMNELINEKIQ